MINLMTKNGSYTALFYTLLISLGASGNFLICLIIACKKSMRTPMNFYLLSLAICDILNCMDYMAVLLLTFSSRYSTVPVPLVFIIRTTFSFIVPFTVTALTAGITTERYLAVCHPLKAMYLCSKSRTVKTITAIWTIPIASAILLQLVLSCESCSQSFLSNEVMFIIVVTLSSIILFLNVLIARTIWKRSSSVTRACNNENYPVSRQTSVNKSLGILAAVLFEFFVFSLPVQVLPAIEKYFQLKTRNTTLYTQLFIIARYLTVISSIVDPFVYILISAKFRRAFKE